MVTADTEEASATRAVEMGAWDYYTKPILTEELRLIATRAARVRHLQGAARSAGAVGHEAPDFESWLGVSAQARRARELLESIARLEAPVLVLGEHGSGKDLAASALHRLGSRSEGAFVRALGADGLSTPADLPSRGLVFLDDLTSFTPADLDRLPEWLDAMAGRARVVASAPEDLPSRVQAGRFPERTYHAFATLSVVLPPLRDRSEDILVLARSLLRSTTGRLGTSVEGFTPDAEAALVSYRWPGNFRELEKRVLGGVLVADGRFVRAEDLSLWPREGRAGKLRENLARVERDLVEEALRSHGGNISRAANELAVSRPTMHALVRKHGLEPRRYRKQRAR
jgi:two-component system NtrC family response regulator